MRLSVTVPAVLVFVSMTAGRTNVRDSARDDSVKEERLTRRAIAL